MTSVWLLGKDATPETKTHSLHILALYTEEGGFLVFIWLAVETDSFFLLEAERKLLSEMNCLQFLFGILISEESDHNLLDACLAVLRHFAMDSRE